MGLREQKKAKTRRILADVALRLFLDKGYENVTVAEIAAEAEVSVTTLFKYFPSKESLVFDDVEEYDENLTRAVLSRPEGTSILESLHGFFLSLYGSTRTQNELSSRFRQLIRQTPALADYSRRVWAGRTDILAQVLATATGLRVAETQAIACLIQSGANWALESDTPRESLEQVLTLVKQGWNR